PGVSNSTIPSLLFTFRGMAATLRVILGAFSTWPKRGLRPSVRNNEVLPTLVWPATVKCKGLGIIDFLFKPSAIMHPSNTAFCQCRLPHSLLCCANCCVRHKQNPHFITDHS